MKTETFEIKKTDGKTIRGFSFFADGEGKHDTVIVCHGFASCYEEFYHHGEGFAKEGINAIFFDFCGGGPKVKSDGDMRAMSVLTEKEDLKVVLKSVQKWDCVNESRIFLMGESQGGFVAAHLATEMPEAIAGLILWYPAFNIPEACKKRLKEAKPDLFGFPVGTPYDQGGASVDIYKELPKYKKPVLMLHGDHDQTVPPEGSKKALGLFPDPKLITLPGEGHGFEGKMSRRAEDLSVAFVKGNFLEVLMS